MGICCSCDSTTPASTTVKLILLDGELQEFSCPIKVSLLLPPNSNCKSFICNADEMDFDEYVSAMNGEQELRQGQLYFELPTSWLTRRLEAEDMASLAVKASAALTQSISSGGVKCGCWMKRVDPYLGFCYEGEMTELNLGGGGGFGGSRVGGGKERKLNISLSVIIEE